MSQGLHISLHPAALLNISDHHTRITINKRDTNAKVFGALLGTQSGRDVDIMTSFEIVVQAPTSSSSSSSSGGGGKLKVDHAYFVTRRDQFRQVFPTFDFLGWYSVGMEPGEEETEVHKQFLTYNESPLFLQLQPPHLSSPSTSTSNPKDLPLTIYESTLELLPSSSEPQPVFVAAGYEIETGEAERVAVDEVSRALSTGGGGGGAGAGAGGRHEGLLAALSTQRSALSMLQDRIAVILRYLAAISSPSNPPVKKDPETLRQIAALVASLEGAVSSAGSAIEGEGEGQSQEKVEKVEKTKEPTDDFEKEFLTEYNDVLLTNYLAALTRQVASANELLDKHLLLSASSSSSGGPSSSSGGGGEGRGGRSGGGGRKGGFGGAGQRLGEMMFS